jgi:flagellar protein FliS
MFAAATATLPARHRMNHGFANAYAAVGVHTAVEAASPHRLVAMLYEGLLDSLARARGALQRGQIEVKASELSRAQRIVDEGLKAALDPAGGELTQQLDALYAYTSLRITQANLRNDAAAIEECQRLIEPLQQAWLAIAPQADVAARRDAR